MPSKVENKRNKINDLNLTLEQRKYEEEKRWKEVGAQYDRCEKKVPEGKWVQKKVKNKQKKGWEGSKYEEKKVSCNINK